jgi:hypothetical protein
MKKQLMNFFVVMFLGSIAIVATSFLYFGLLMVVIKLTT